MYAQVPSMHVPPSQGTHACHPGQVKSRRKKTKPSTSVYRCGHLIGLGLKERKTEQPPRVASLPGFPSHAASFYRSTNQPRRVTVSTQWIKFSVGMISAALR